jgi:hypothetical protein
MRVGLGLLLLARVPASAFVRAGRGKEFCGAWGL